MSTTTADSNHQKDLKFADKETQTSFLLDSEEVVTKKLTDLESKLSELGSKNEKLTQKIQQLKKQMRTDKEKWLMEGCKWKYKYEESERRIKESTEYSHKGSSSDDNVQSKRDGAKKENDMHEMEITELKERVMTLEEVLKAVQDETDNISEVEKYERKNKQLVNRITITEQSLLTTQNKRNLLEEQIESSERQKKDLLKSLEDSQKEVERLDKELKSVNSETASYGKKRKNQKDLGKETDRLKEDNEKLRMRLSEIAGSLLVDRNPSIADLSDETRPSKLADSFSELYDNQWTDAFEEQEGSEKEAIQHLLAVFTEINKKCQNVASKYLLGLEETSITLPEKRRKILQQTTQIPATIRRLLLEIRKNFTPLILQELTKFFRGKFIGKTKKSVIERKATTRYVEKCTELSWYMAIKDPPVVLGPVPTEEDVVNKDLFHFYTSSGKQVHFCVWPPLLLHKGGSLLRKGIIQGK